MDDRWLIIADDLTGAADSAIAFAKRRVPATVSWGAARPAEHADLATLLEAGGLRARVISLDLVRGDPHRLRASFDEPRAGVTVCVCDAEEAADLDRIADCVDGTATFFAGSA